ncbi:hypothetical protein L6R52_01710 [Myxococcota bacterium]|nr:hypothetical protein [Myxococcota bacterium]
MPSSLDGDDEQLTGDAGAALDDSDPMNPSAWSGEPDVCGSCIAWKPDDPRPGEDVAAGSCKLRPELGRVPASLRKCNIYKPRGQFRYDPNRVSPTRRRKTGAVKVLRRSAEGELVQAKAPPRAPVYRDRPEPEVEVIVERIGRGQIDAKGELVEQEELFAGEDWGTDEPRPPKPVVAVPKEIDLGGDEGAYAVRQALVDLIRKEHGKTSREIHSKYRTGGQAIARTADHDEVAIPAERFFSMLDRLRSSLDTLEKQLAKREGLEEKDELVASLRRIHGSFTTFNLIFSDREDYFSGKE